MVRQYGFHTGDLAIKPFLSQQDVWMDCRDEILPAYRRPGKSTGYYIIQSEDVEPYYRSKQLPETVITRKLRELKLVF